MAKPSMYSKSIILNLLGMQWYRIIFFYLLRVLRPTKKIQPKYEKYLKELEKEGVVAIPNFFSEEDYQKLLEEYERLIPLFSDTNHGLLPHVDGMNIHDKRVSSATKQLFLNNELINSIVPAYLNRKLHLPTPIEFNRIYCSKDEASLPKNGGTNNLHFDAPMRIAKAFYYIHDINEDNGALRYCKKSQKRNSLKRLLFEYKLSVRYAINKWNKNDEGEYKDNDPWVAITEKEIKKHNLKEEPISGKGNTLVIFDVGGFHRRGDNYSVTRDTVQINYRNINTIRNEFYPIEKKLLKLMAKNRS